MTRLVDFVDVDSEKWIEYARWRGWPLSLLYRREGRRLLAFDRRVAGWADASVFVTSAEAALFKKLAPGSATSVQVIRNGVDADFFCPDHDLPSPFPVSEQPIVFTGAMDYWPNVDAAHWFASEVLPLVRAEQPMARFYVVGNRPSASLETLGRRDDVVVTGKVPDVRPYLKHAQVVVAPLRVARGVQNKVLEAMAMAKATVVSEAAAAGVAARPAEEIQVASDADDYSRKILALLGSPRAQTMGRAARARVLAEHDWSLNLSRIDELLGTSSHSQRCAEGTTDCAARPLSAV
jgi:sugar transferase (PEP-CTERM/EpsH1 system associated)